jgi:hypothetical protein
MTLPQDGVDHEKEQTREDAILRESVVRTWTSDANGLPVSQGPVPPPAASTPGPVPGTPRGMGRYPRR